MSYRYRPRYGRQRVYPAAVAACVVLAFAGVRAHAAASPHTHTASAAHRTASARGARAVAYARHRVGWVPYVYGGTTDAGTDCSGLTMDAWASAGVTIERTSEQQWASERHVTSPQPGDLVFFGGDGTPDAPGHVGIVTDPARHKMIDAYVPGTDVRFDTYGLPSSAQGLTDPVGFTDPGGA